MRVYTCLIFSALSLFSLTANAGFLSNIFIFLIDKNGSLTGTVTNAETNQPLANATVSLPDLRIAVTTNAQGIYKINNLPNGNFTITVSYIGYKSFAGTVAIKNETIKDCKLSVSAVENENVIVTGVAATTQLKHAPSHISVITQKELQQSSGTNLLDAIARQPGVSIVTTGPAIAKPSIRGLSYNRVVTINDGVRQEGQQWGDEHGVEIDEYSAQKVEVLRGPSSLMYGSDAIGGVINILTNVPVANNTIKANISGSLNGNNNMLGGYANVAGNINGFNWNVYGSRKGAGDYKNKFDGNVLNSRFNEKNIGGSIGINKSWGFTHLLISNFDQHVGLIEGDRGADGHFILDGYTINKSLADSKALLIPNQRIQHFKIALDNAFTLHNGGRITALVGFQRNQRQEFGDVDTPDNPEAFFDLKTINYNTAYHVPVLSGWKTSIGINGMSQQNKNRSDEALIPNYSLFDFGIYGYTTKTIHASTISGGIRFDNRSIQTKQTYEDDVLKFENFNKNLSSVSGSLGIAHDLSNEITLKANVSKGFRAPNMAELFANGIHEGTYRYETGNSDLKSENSIAADMGLEVNTKHISLNISPYFNRINNYIYYQKLLTNSGADSITQNVATYKFTQQTANLYGLEANLDIHPHPLDWLHFENTFSLVGGKFAKPVDGSGNLPLISPARLLTQLRAEFANQLTSFKNLYMKLEMDHVSTQNDFFAGYNTETATKGYTLFNAGVGTDFDMNGKRIASLYIALNNFTDVAYQNHLSRLKYAPENPATGRTGIYNMGRNFTMRLLIPLSWQIK